MKKIFLTTLLCFIVGIGTTACVKENLENDRSKDGINNELFQCLESELGGYLLTEYDTLVEIPLSEIKGKNNDKIAYYKGVYASNHKENVYVIVYPNNGTYEADVMNDFDNYFNKHFSVYQKIETVLFPTIYIHTQENDINVNDLINACLVKNDNKGKDLDSKVIRDLESTDKIIIKSGENLLGEIIDNTKITKILKAISSSKQLGIACLSDGHGFDLEMYDNNRLIETIYVWGDGKRLMPASIEGCYYTISNETDLRKVIEDETDYVFYSILDYSDSCDTQLELIYENDKNKYFLNCIKSDKVMIKFMIENRVMSLKYALENHVISAEKVASEYPDVLIKKPK
ncbi:MAG: hypothetical protein E7164_01270 [Firmicutes bacterium]|nr:hypothetical protein [Bacillota bacterium]